MPKSPALPSAPTPLRYIGDGSCLPDIPARDLDADEVQTLITAGVSTLQQLLDSGLYTPRAAATPPPQE